MAELPHVTTILQRAGLVDVTWFTEAGRDLGSAVHAACQFLDEGDLDWGTVDPAVLPRVRQYQRFLEEVKPNVIGIEVPVTNHAPDYQGRPDRIVEINGRRGILDLKGPAEAPWQAIQVCMYAACYAQQMVRWTLHLHDDRYKLIEHNDRHDWTVAKAAITIAAWKEKHGE